MKKLFLGLFFALCTVSSFSSCAVSCSNVKAETKMPLVKYAGPPAASFSTILNNTAVDIVFTQESNYKVELMCPEGYDKYIKVKIAGGVLSVDYTDAYRSDKGMFGNDKLNRALAYSKIYVSNARLSKVEVNGSSEFSVSGDLRVEMLDLQLNGSGDIKLNGVQSNTSVLAKLNGSGDVEFRKELKAHDAEMQLNGSGDVDAVVVTAEKFRCALNGSGDVEVHEVAAVDVNASLNGSGDMEVSKIYAEVVKGTLNGSGDMELRGKCNNAVLRLTRSGDLSAKRLEAEEVDAEVVGSGDIECYPVYKLKASVKGSGEIRYKGNPEMMVDAKRGSVTRIGD